MNAQITSRCPICHRVCYTRGTRTGELQVAKSQPLNQIFPPGFFFPLPPLLPGLSPPRRGLAPQPPLDRSPFNPNYHPHPLSKGLTSVVKASITGSIIGNVLLVLGLSILWAVQYEHFPPRTSVISALAGCDRLDHPDGLSSGRRLQSWRLRAGRAEALPGHRGCLVLYLLLHARFLALDPQAFLPRRPRTCQERGKQWSRGKAITILLISTAVVAVLSEFLVGTIENVRDSVGVTEVFVGVIVVAIVGNAAEHSAAFSWP